MESKESLPTVRNESGFPLDVAHFDPIEAKEEDLRAYLDMTKEVITEVSPDLPVPDYDAFVAQLEASPPTRAFRLGPSH